MPGVEGKLDGARAALGAGEAPVLAGDGALKSAQTEVGHIPVCRGLGVAPLPRALPIPAVLARQGAAVAGGVPGVGLSAGGEQGRTR